MVHVKIKSIMILVRAVPASVLGELVESILRACLEEGILNETFQRVLNHLWKGYMVCDH